jgi:endonuclease/exonuclease/phosphatase family metal-dependent hydrolase
MRLLSWNIHKGIGGRDRRYALDRIVACIEAENPDLV